MSANPLLTTKTNIPPRRPTLIGRPRLLEKLDRSLQPGNRLTILSAPAGFGKTSLIVDWLSSLSAGDVQVAWLSLDEGDNDLARFLRYLLAALQKIQPGLGLTTLAVLELPQLPPVNSLMVPLINEIGDLSHGLVLILDDYQLITDLAVNQAIAYLVEHQPPLFHLVLTTRTDPMLPLARLRARGEVNEIRSIDLRFTDGEALDFIQHTTRITLAPGQLAELEQRTEGWAAGLQIAAIAMQAFRSQQVGNDKEIDRFLASFSGTHQYVFDYLAEEVLNQQNPEVKKFLYQTSILDRLHPSLCNAVTRRNDSERILKTLDQSNLFIHPLDEHRQWYRYHRLFADFLQADLDPALKPELYQRACDWFERNDFIDDAVKCAFSVQDWPNAVRLVGQATNSMLKSGEITTLIRWFNTFPPGELQADPDLCIYAGWASILQSSLSVGNSLVEQAEKSLRPDSSASTRGRLRALHAILHYAVGHIQDAVAAAEEAVQLMDPAEGFIRTMTLSLLGQIQRSFGLVTESIRTYEEAIHSAQALAAAEGRRYDAGLCVLQGNLAITYYYRGERRKAAAYCAEAIRQYTDPQGKIYPLAFFIYLPWANICFDGNELEEAQQHLMMGFELCRNTGTNPTVIGGASIAAAIQLIHGDVQGAFSTIRAYRDDALRIQATWVASTASAMEAWFYLLMGNLAEVEAWAASGQLPAMDRVDPLRITEQLVYANFLISKGDFQQAYDLLTIQRQHAEQFGRMLHVSDIKILLAMACRGLGRHEEALDLFEQAVRLAAPEGRIRSFLDYDTLPLANDLKSRLAGSSDVLIKDFLDQVLTLPRPGKLADQPNPRPMVTPTRPAQPGLVEPISPRELEVLQLMAEGLSNADIARRLFLTINTMKAHTNSIYGKLEVHSRMQAVIRARELGLLPGEN